MLRQFFYDHIIHRLEVATTRHTDQGHNTYY